MRLYRLGLLFAAAMSSMFACGGKETGEAGGGGSGAGASGSGAGGEGAGSLPCPSGFADCDGDPSNGCEGALSTSAKNCGACGKACEAGSHETPLCSAGACVRVCEAGFADCNGDAADGCEVDILGDAAHCGSCEKACKSACVSGACDILTIATGQARPSVIALDDANIYWVNNAGFAPGAGSIMKAAKAGSAPVTLADKQSAPRALALDATSIYWSNAGTPPAFTDGAVMAAPKDGSGAPRVIASGQASPYGIALRGSALYFTTAAEILMIDKDAPAATPVSLAKDQKRPIDIFAVGSTIYWLNFGTEATPTADGSLMMMPEGGAPVELESKLLLPTGLTLDPAGAYLYYRVEGAIRRAPVGGGPGEVFIEGLKLLPFLIAADTDTIYFTDQAAFGGGVNAVTVSTRQRSLLVPNQTFPWGIAIDPTAVYWVSSASGDGPVTGALRKIAR